MHFLKIHLISGARPSNQVLVKTIIEVTNQAIQTNISSITEIWTAFTDMRKTQGKRKEAWF
jgi:hypothetical protein